LSKHLFALLLLLSIVSSALVNRPALVNSLLRGRSPRRGGVTVLVQVVVLADLVEEEHQTSVRGDLGKVSQSTSPQSNDSVLLDGLANAIPQSSELDIHIRSEGLLVLSLHLLTDRIEGEGDGLSNRTSQASVDEVLQSVQLATRLAPHVGQNLVRHELQSSEGNHTENGSSQTLVEGKESLLLEDHSEGVDDTLVLQLTVDLHSKTGLHHIQRIHAHSGDHSSGGSSNQRVPARQSSGLRIGHHLLHLSEHSEVDGRVGEQTEASNTVALPESLHTLLTVHVLEGSNETSVLLGTDLSDNLDHIQRGGESTGTNSGNTSSNEVLPESETTILLLTHGAMEIEKKL